MSKPADKSRWSALRLGEPELNASLPEGGSTADLLAFALVLPGAEDPILGIIDAVRKELECLSSGASDLAAGDVLLMLSNRLAVASLLLRRVDERAPTPPEWDDPDNEVTKDAAPDEGEGDA